MSERGRHVVQLVQIVEIHSQRAGQVGVRGEQLLPRRRKAGLKCAQIAIQDFGQTLAVWGSGEGGKVLRLTPR